jgi:4-hydroxy-tetrahydrodipicolinate synthase
MGAMQMLSDATYRELVEHSTRFGTRGGEILVGVGDTSLSRTRDRIEFLNRWTVTGAVVLTPFFLTMSQAELVDYFLSLAEFSRNPLFLYDSPGLTRIRLEIETVLRLAEHPNIAGIKCVGELGAARQLLDMAPRGFRVVIAQADLIDVLLHHGVREHLDGVFSLAPFWVSGIQKAAAAGDWEMAAQYQSRLSSILSVLKRYGVFPTFGALLNERGIGGNYAPAPMRKLSEANLTSLMAEPIVGRLLGDSSESPMHAAISELSKRPLTV